jgi:hypothetical protein
VVELGELLDHARELAGDQVPVGRRAGVRVVGGLIGEMLHEQQVVGLRQIPVDPERHGALLGAGTERRELPHDRLDLVLHAVLELDRENLHQHGDLLSCYDTQQDSRADGSGSGHIRTGIRVRIWPVK